MSKIAYLEKYSGTNVPSRSRRHKRSSGTAEKSSRKRAPRNIRDDTPDIPTVKHVNTDTTGLFESLAESDEDEMPSFPPDTDPSLIKEFEMERLISAGRLSCPTVANCGSLKAARHEAAHPKERSTENEIVGNYEKLGPGLGDSCTENETCERICRQSPLPTSSKLANLDGGSIAEPRDLSPPRRRIAAQRTDTPTQEGQIVFRDKEGKPISEAEWLRLQNDSKRKRQRKPEQVLEWGSGLRQKKDIEQTKRDEAKVEAEPIARYCIDDEFDGHLKSIERWGDPIAMLESSPQKGSGSKGTARPKCRFDAVPNRYGISPGYRWDGVIRGTGFEEKLLKERNTRKHQEEEEYKWSVHDW